MKDVLLGEVVTSSPDSFVRSVVCPSVSPKDVVIIDSAGTMSEIVLTVDSTLVSVAVSNCPFTTFVVKMSVVGTESSFSVVGLLVVGKAVVVVVVVVVFFGTM